MHLPAADYFYYLFVGKNSFILKKTGIYRRLDNINVKKKNQERKLKTKLKTKFEIQI